MGGLINSQLRETMEQGFALKVEFYGLTCEAGVSVEPEGRKPQGTAVLIESPRMRAKVE